MNGASCPDTRSCKAVDVDTDADTDTDTDSDLYTDTDTDTDLDLEMEDEEDKSAGGRLSTKYLACMGAVFIFLEFNILVSIYG
jgi:hypothetical protein